LAWAEIFFHQGRRGNERGYVHERQLSHDGIVRKARVSQEPDLSLRQVRQGLLEQERGEARGDLLNPGYLVRLQEPLQLFVLDHAGRYPGVTLSDGQG